MKKKSIIILAAVVVVCALGLLLSPLANWTVDSDSTSGNISKSSRFSRKTATEHITNMEELLQNDEAYKDGIMVAYTVMQTRAMQFGTLVDMSNQVAGNIPEYADVLKAMNEAVPIIKNVSASLAQAGNDLNATLAGESCPEVGQNTINASLAYTTLQKQNALATRFIQITDDYIKNADADDRLKLVRDQWVDYQTMTAALEGDDKSAAELKEKGTLLNSEKTLNALGSFDIPFQISMLASTFVSNSMGLAPSLSLVIPDVDLSMMPDVMHATAEAMKNSESATGALAAWGDVVEHSFSNTFSEALGHAGRLENQTGALKSTSGADALASTQNVESVLSLEQTIGSVANAISAFQNVVVKSTVTSESALNMNTDVLCSQVNGVIKQTAAGEVSTMNFLTTNE